MQFESVRILLHSGCSSDGSGDSSGDGSSGYGKGGRGIDDRGPRTASAQEHAV